MGILAQDLNTLKKYHPNPKSMLELGNQYLYIFQNQKPFDEYPDKYLTNGNVVVAKEYFQELGIDHVSLDYTGNDGALKGDLDYPIDLKRTFDVITDFGTSEHCTNLYQVHKNIHNHSHIGTTIFHANPLIGNWPQHGVYYRKSDFYEKLCSAMEYELLETYTGFVLGNSTDGWNVYGVYRKVKDIPFMKKEEFDKLPFIAEEVSPLRTQV